MIANPWAIAGGALLVIAALGGAYLQGRADGRHGEQAKAIKALERARVALEKGRIRVDAVNGLAAAAQVAQQQETRTIYERATTVIERPIYRNVCVDADGGGLLDRARANANRGIAGESAGAAP